MCDGTSLLQSHGGEFVVSVEEETRGDQVDPDGRSGLAHLPEFTETGSFLDEDEGERHQETKDGGDGELVSDGSNAFLEAIGFHELLVFVTTNSSKDVGNASRDQGRPGKVQFLNGSQDDSSNDDRQAQPLGGGDLLSVDELGKDGGKGGFRSLNNLGERNGTHTHGEDRSAVSTHEAESDGKHFDNIGHGDSGLLTSIGSQPEEDSVKASNTQLQTRDSHGETSLSSSSVQGELVGNVVVVVTEVPEGKVGQETKVDSSFFGVASTRNFSGFTAKKSLLLSI